MADTKVEIKQGSADAQAVGDKPSSQTLDHALPANKDLVDRVLPTPRAPVAEILEQRLRTDDQRQEQSLYSGIWAGWSAVVVALAKTPAAEKNQGDRQKMEALQEDIFHALAKEKKKKAFRESPIFQRLVAVMGPEVAESVTKKLELAISNNPSGLQANTALLTQVAKDLATVLEKNQASLKISTGGNNLAATIEAEMSRNLAIQPSPSAPPSRADEKVRALHDQITSLTPGKDQMVKVLEMYGSLKREEFVSLVDAYDKAYGIPLVDHIAQMSGGSPAARAEVFEELVSVLTPEQKERHVEYGRAELGLTLASLSVEQKNAEEGIKSVTAELRKTASHLGDASLLNIPNISSLSVAERKVAIEAAVRREFPGLKDAKDWQAIIKSMTAVQKDGAADRSVVHNEQLVSLLGTKSIDPKQEGAIRERIARITLLMGDLVRYEEQAGQLGKIAIGGNSNEVALVTAAYIKMYGKEVSDSGSGLKEITKAGQAHLDGLAFRITDPHTSEAERAALIRERDAIEFSSVKTRLGIHLEGEKPDVARAQALLSLFETANIDTPARRGAAYRQIAGDLSRAITAAEEYRQQWLKVTPDALRPITVVKESTTVNCATHHEKPRELSPHDINGAFLSLAQKPGANKENSLMYFKSESERKKALAELEELHRDAAKTLWFAEVLNPGYVLTKTKGPTSEQLHALLDAKKEATARTLAPLGKELDLVHERTRSGLWAIEQSSHSGFLSHDALTKTMGQVSPGIRSKVGAGSRVEIVERLSQLLDGERPVVVSAATLTALRDVASSDKILQPVLKSVKTGEPSEQLSDILARLSPSDALRVRTFVTLHTLGRSPGNPKAIFDQINASPLDVLAQVEAASKAEAKFVEVDRILGPLTGTEREEVLNAFFESTGTTVASRARTLIPTGLGREQVVVAFAQTTFVSEGDLRDFFDGAVPDTTEERVKALHQAFAQDRGREKELDAITFQPTEALREFGLLRAAAQTGGMVGDHTVVEESTRALADVEREADRSIEEHVKRFTPGFAARQGVVEIAKARREQVVASIITEAVQPDKKIAINATLAASHLGSDPAKADAAYHQIRQANLSASEMLLFRAFYREAALNRKPEEKTRPLTGDFEKDLTSAKEAQTEYERTRNAALVKGGNALKEADTLAVKNLAKLPEEQQLGALIDLKKSGQLDAHKDSIDPTTLKGDAKTYHSAVTEKPKSSTDDGNRKVRAEALELKHKVSLKSATEDDAVALVSGKSAAQMTEIKKVYPKVAEDLKVVAPKMANEVDGLLSQNEAEQRKAVERSLMNSLKNPLEFEKMLAMARSQEAKAEILSSIERRIALNGRHFDPSESAIVQFVRSQRTDFREIDAVLFSDILARHGFGGRRLDPEMASQLLALRAQGASQLEKMDAFHALRSSVLKDALRYSSDKESHLGNAEADKTRRLVTGWLRNDEIVATRDLISHHNKNILNPMTAGEADIRRSRELMRMGVAIIAKDLQQGVDGGVTLGSTQQVMTLNVRRDKEIAYKVFDEAKERAWKSEVARTEKWIGYADTTVMVGMMFAKTIVVTGATLYGSPLAGLAVATAWNAADKAYRVTLQGESIRHALVSGGVEFGFDLLFAGVSAYAHSRLVLQGGKTSEGAIEAASKTFREWRWTEPVVKPTQIEQVVEKGIVWRTGQSGKLKELFADIKNGAEIGEKAADTGFKFQQNAINSQLAGKIDFVPEWMGVGTSIWRKGGGGVPSELVQMLVPRDKEGEGVGAAKPQATSHGQGSQGTFGPSVDTDPKTLVAPLDALGKAAQTAPALPNPPQEQWQVPLTIWSYVAILEQALAAKPDPALQRELDNLKGLLASPTVSEAEALAAARRVQEALEAAKERDKDKPEWTPYPDLAKALNGWLDAGNPWLALGGALFGYEPPAPPPAAPPSPPPVSPAPSVKPAKPPTPPPGAPGFGLQIAMSPVGGKNGNGDANGNSLTRSQQQGDVTGLPNQQGIFVANGVGTPNILVSQNAQGVATTQTYTIANVNGSTLAHAHFTPQVDAHRNVQRTIMMNALPNVDGYLHTQATAVAGLAEATRVAHPNSQAVANATATTQEWARKVAEATALRDRDAAKVREKEAARTEAEVKDAEKVQYRMSLAKVSALEAPQLKSATDEVAVPEKATQGAAQSSRSDNHTEELIGNEYAKKMSDNERVPTTAHEQVLALKGAQPLAGEGASVSVGGVATSDSSEGSKRDSSEGSKSDRSVVSKSDSSEVSKREVSLAVQEGRSVGGELISPVTTHASQAGASSLVHGQTRALANPSEVASITIEDPRSTQHVVPAAHPTVEADLPPEIHAILRGEESGAHTRDSEETQGAPSPRARSKRNAAADARMRATILRQLMESHFTKVQREKLLKMLIALGISESEYRALVIKLGEMDVARKAEQESSRRERISTEERDEVVQSEPVKMAVPAMKGEKVDAPTPAPPTNTPAAKASRAQLYRQLREETAPKVKDA